jgi:hypothetical protein
MFCKMKIMFSTKIPLLRRNRYSFNFDNLMKIKFFHQIIFLLYLKIDTLSTKTKTQINKIKIMSSTLALTRAGKSKDKITLKEEFLPPMSRSESKTLPRDYFLHKKEIKAMNLHSLLMPETPDATLKAKKAKIFLKKPKYSPQIHYRLYKLTPENTLTFRRKKTKNTNFLSNTNLKDNKNHSYSDSLTSTPNMSTSLNKISPSTTPCYNFTSFFKNMQYLLIKELEPPDRMNNIFMTIEKLSKTKKNLKNKKMIAYSA